MPAAVCQRVHHHHPGPHHHPTYPRHRLYCPHHRHAHPSARTVEGVDHCKGHSTVFGRESDCTFPSASGQDLSIPASFWGENLMGAKTHPVRVHDASGAEVSGKVVYSPHSYGPSVFDQGMFHDPMFPSNMPRIWDAQYGRLGVERHDAIIIGEWSAQREGSNFGKSDFAACPLATHYQPRPNLDPVCSYPCVCDPSTNTCLSHIFH